MASAIRPSAANATTAVEIVRFGASLSPLPMAFATWNETAGLIPRSSIP